MLPLLLATVLSIGEITPETMPQEESIVKFPKGTKLPIEFFLDGNVCSIKDNQFCVNKTFFVKLTSDELYFSWDGEHWLTFLEAFTGNIRTEINADEKVKLILGGELNPR